MSLALLFLEFLNINTFVIKFLLWLYYLVPVYVCCRFFPRHKGRVTGIIVGYNYY